MKKRKYILLCLFLALLYHFLWIFDPLLSIAYDFITQQKETKTISFSSFQTLSFDELPAKEQQKYKEKTCDKFHYQTATFIKVTGFERYKNIIEDVKIYQLLTPDRLIKNRVRIPSLNKVQYCIISAEVLTIYQELREKLNAQNLNPNAIKITSAFRHPAYNALVKGATCSQHQMGNALDVSVGDVNKDKKVDKVDRDLVVTILEKKLIRNQGGLGTYKNQPKLVHFDTRGYRARW